MLALAATLAGAAFAAGWLLGLVIADVVARRTRAAASSSLLFAVGVGPLAFAGAAVLVFVLPAFVLFEPAAASASEAPGAVLIAMALAGGALLLRTAHRIVGMLRASRRILRDWARGAEPLPVLGGIPAMRIDIGRPVVAVSGVVRAALYIDRQVLERCTADEIDAIAAHEFAHVQSRDNVRRLLLVATRGTHPVVAAWRDASELEADRVAGRDARRGLALASALVKVARAGRVPHLDGIAASSVHDGGHVDRRVRALLAPRPAPAARRPGGRAAAVAGLCLLAPVTWRAVHEFIEVLVNRLP
jgi:Zn-dependent protease with chaperone function